MQKTWPKKKKENNCCIALISTTRFTRRFPSKKNILVVYPVGDWMSSQTKYFPNLLNKAHNHLHCEIHIFLSRKERNQCAIIHLSQKKNKKMCNHSERRTSFFKFLCDHDFTSRLVKMTPCFSLLDYLLICLYFKFASCN